MKQLFLVLFAALVSVGAVSQVSDALASDDLTIKMHNNVHSQDPVTFDVRWGEIGADFKTSSCSAPSFQTCHASAPSFSDVEIDYNVYAGSKISLRSPPTSNGDIIFGYCHVKGQSGHEGRAGATTTGTRTAVSLDYESPPETWDHPWVGGNCFLKSAFK